MQRALSVAVHACAQAHLLALQAAVAAVVFAAFSLLRPARMGTYLVDFYCYRPPDRCLPRGNLARGPVLGLLS